MCINDSFFKSMKIPLLKPFMAETVHDKVQKVLTSNWIGYGNEVKSFEAEIMGKYSIPYFLATSSGSTAIQISLDLLDLTREDEVITTPLTCLATNIPLIKTGAKIIWADIKRNGTISSEDVKNKITEKTKAIIVVHFGGTPCDLDEIRSIANNYAIPVIEDAAHAIGSSYKGNFIGTHSEFVCFSFQSVKMLTTVDGGGLALKSPETYYNAKMMRWFGIDRDSRKKGDFNVHLPGIKGEMNNLSAAIGIENLKNLDKLITHNRKLAKMYSEKLKEIDGIKIIDYNDKGISNNWLYTIWVEDRASLQEKLMSYGVESGQIHYRNDKVLLFNKYKQDQLQIMNEWEEHALSIPIGYWITENDSNDICEIISSGW